jgi:hypothetical protein
MITPTKKSLLLLSTAGLILAGPALAEWQLITDWESVTKENQPVWKRFPPQGDLYFDGLDPDDVANKHYYVDPGLQVDGQNNQIWTVVDLPGEGVAEGAIATLKYRVYLYGDPMNVNIGLTDVAFTVDDSLDVDFGQLEGPQEYGNFESQIAFNGIIFNPRDGSGFSPSETATPLNEWVWVYHVIDNGRDVTRFYYKTAAMSVPEQIRVGGTRANALFRNGTTDTLINLLIANAGSNVGPVSIMLTDDFQIDYTGVNLDGGTDVDDDPMPMWGGYNIEPDANGNPWVNTGAWMGWLSLVNGGNGDAEWVYSLALDSFFYFPKEPAEGDTGSWVFGVR